MAETNKLKLYLASLDWSFAIPAAISLAFVAHLEVVCVLDDDDGRCGVLSIRCVTLLYRTTTNNDHYTAGGVHHRPSFIHPSVGARGVLRGYIQTVPFVHTVGLDEIHDMDMVRGRHTDI